MAKLKSNTIVSHPETGEPKVLLAGEDAPDWAGDLLGEHLFDEAEEPEQGTVEGAPPKAGRGSGLEAWQKYADDNQIAYTEGATRDDIIAAVEAHQAGQ